MTTQEEEDFLVRDEEGLRRILGEVKSIAVVGLSGDRSRASHRVASYLKDAGYRIIPVNPNAQFVLGEPAIPDLTQLPKGVVDCVEIFRRSSEVAAHVDEAIAAGAKVIWMQDGVIDPASARRAHEAGLKVVMNRCMYRDHARLVGRGR